MGKPPSIQIIKYPFSGGAALNRSFAAPGIVQSIAGDLLPGDIDWATLPVFTKKPTTRRYKNLRNYGAVKEAVTKLGIEIGRTQLAGHKTLVLGGDHTQGIATVKVSALILVVRAILDGSIPVKSKNTLNILHNATLRKRIVRTRKKGVPLGENVVSTREKDVPTGERIVPTGEKGVKLDTDIVGLGELVSDYVRSGVITRKALSAFLDNIAVIWLDSHADYNDRHSSPSGNIHGMSLAACAGLDIGGIEDLFGGDAIKLKPENFYILCARDIDENERTMMERDGVHYRKWELTRPGAMRTHDDPDNPVTLKKHLDALLKRLKNKHVIFSMDVDAIHAGVHKSPYSIESVAATGTPMGLRRRDMKSTFRRASSPEDMVRLNTEQQSPAGPTAGDVFEAIHGILNQPNVVAADLSEISPAAGEQGRPVTEKERGLTIETSIRVMGAMAGMDLTVLTRALNKRIPQLEKLVQNAIRAEKKI